MKIAHFNTFAEGGAAILMMRLHTALLKQKVESQIYYRRGHLSESHSQIREFVTSQPHKFLERAKWRFESWVSRHSNNLFSTSHSPAQTTLGALGQSADIFHFHWISRWLDFPKFIKSLPSNAPIVFTIHDLGNLTGGCHLYSGCHNFEKGCQRCPLLKAPFNSFLPKRELQRKRQSLRSRPIFVIGNSRWTTQLASSALVFSEAAAFKTIPPGIELDQCVRTDKRLAKTLLGISPDQFTIGFGCAELTDKNKNFTAFLELLNKLSSKISVEAIVFGNGLKLTSDPPAPIHYLGKLASGPLQSLAYSAMDVFIMTSGIETFGQVAIEAQACGTPVCAFAVGGLPEAVIDGQTGWLVPAGNTELLSNQVMTLARDKKMRSLFSEYGYNWSRSTFTMEQAAKLYLNLYREALGGQPID